MDWVAGVSFVLFLFSLVFHLGVMCTLYRSDQRFAAAWFWLSAGAASLAFVYLCLMVWRLGGVDHAVWCWVADLVDLAALIMIWVLPPAMALWAARMNRGGDCDC